MRVPVDLGKHILAVRGHKKFIHVARSSWTIDDWNGPRQIFYSYCGQMITGVLDHDSRPVDCSPCVERWNRWVYNVPNYFPPISPQLEHRIQWQHVDHSYPQLKLPIP